jgi:carbonic anhydrase
MFITFKGPTDGSDYKENSSSQNNKAESTNNTVLLESDVSLSYLGAPNAELSKLGFDTALRDEEWLFAPIDPSFTVTGLIGSSAASGYYTFPGSLTTPPCTQGVTWVVLSTPSSVGSRQVANFPFANNFRPPQPRNGRPFFFGKQFH